MRERDKQLVLGVVVKSRMYMSGFPLVKVLNQHKQVRKQSKIYSSLHYAASIGCRCVDKTNICNRHVAKILPSPIAKRFDILCYITSYDYIIRIVLRCSPGRRARSST